MSWNEKNEAEWLKTREDAHDFMLNRNKKLIEEWAKSAGVKTPIGFYNDSNGTLTIYTDKCGQLIGYHGETVNYFKEVLKKEFGKEYKINFVEVKGGFVNLG